MARFNTVLATLSAVGLTLAQPAAAATRAPAATAGESEAMAGIPPGSGAVIGILGLIGLVFIIMAISDGDDSDDLPNSP